MKSLAADSDLVKPSSLPIPPPAIVALIADDGCDRYDVVGICGVAHPQEKSHREDGKKADHVLYLDCFRLPLPAAVRPGAPQEISNTLQCPPRSWLKP